MLIKKFSERVKLVEDVDVIICTFLNKKGRIMGRKRLEGFDEKNIPFEILITYERK